MHAISPRRNEYSKRLRGVTAWGMVANLALAAVKLAAGVLGGSQALVADAVHSVSDSATDVAVLVGERFWTQPADAGHPYGHGRIETMVTVAIGVALAAVGVGLAWNALSDLGSGRRAVPGMVAFWAACLSMAVKEGLYRWTVRVGREIRSTAVLANAWHHRSDALSSLPVAVAVLGSRLAPGWWFLDGVAAVVVAVFILGAAREVSWPALQHLLDAGASAEVKERLMKTARGVDGVRDVHALRTRHIGSGLQVDLHVLVDRNLSVRQGHEIVCRVERALREQSEVVDALAHMEPWEGSSGPGGNDGNGGDSDASAQ